MQPLLYDLAELECRLASIALAAGQRQHGATLISRAVWLLRLRNAAQAPGLERIGGSRGPEPASE